MADRNNKCGHSACSCSVGDDSNYCSPACEAVGSQDISDITCNCGHPGCSGDTNQ